MSEPMLFKPLLFKGQLYFQSAVRNPQMRRADLLHGDSPLCGAPQPLLCSRVNSVLNQNWDPSMEYRFLSPY